MIKPIGALLLGFTVSAGAATLPPVSAVLTQETGAIGADGITRTSHFQDRMLRDASHVWTQRVLPKAAPHVHAPAHEHEHPDFTLAGRLVTPGKNGKADLVMVVPEEKLVVTLDAVDYEEQGFSRCWPCAAHLIDPAALKRMTVSARSGGLVTYSRRDKQSELVVVWDDALQLAREIRERRLDGSRWSTLRTQVQPGPVDKPWLPAARYLRRTMGDYGD